MYKELHNEQWRKQRWKHAIKCIWSKQLILQANFIQLNTSDAATKLHSTAAINSQIIQNKKSQMLQQLIECT